MRCIKEERVDETIDSFVNNLTEEREKRLCVEYRSRFPYIGESNPLDAWMEKPHIVEGLVMTYPAETTVRYVKDYFGLEDGQIITGKQNGVDFIACTIANKGDNVKKIEKAMDFCGYFLSMAKDRGQWIELKFEPRFSEDDTKEIRQRERYLFHITPSYNRDKIKHIGLSPRCRNELFNYPNRVYFLYGSTSDRIIISMMAQLCASNRSKGNDMKYTLFTVDLEKTPSNVLLYKDPNHPYGVFTSANIPPSAIIKEQELDYVANFGE